MTKILSAYLAGALTIAAAVVFADGRSALMLIVGAFAVLTVQGLLLSSARRIRRAGRALMRIAEAIDPGRRQARKAIARVQEADQPAPSEPAVAEISDALISLGFRGTKKARTTAAAAVAQGGTFDQMLRRAIDSAKAAA